MAKIAVVLSVAFGVISLVASEDKYTTKWDNIDVDSILKSDRLLRNYFNCLLDKGRCTPDGAELKSKFNFQYEIIEIISLESFCNFVCDNWQDLITVIKQIIFWSVIGALFCFY